MPHVCNRVIATSLIEVRDFLPTDRIDVVGADRVLLIRRS